MKAQGHQTSDSNYLALQLAPYPLDNSERKLNYKISMYFFLANLASCLDSAIDYFQKTELLFQLPEKKKL